MERSVSAEPQSDDTLVPPTAMLFDGTSSPEEFKAFGESFLQYILVQRAHLSPSASILDLGCGNGSVARALTRFLAPAGRYEGLDINAKGVVWLQQRYAGYANFRFTHANVYNKAYNADGAVQPGDYRLPFDDAVFDVVLLKSVFTHMLPADVRRYLSEIARVLKPGGRWSSRISF
jgi:ubiquinone/menaquinone biosynthesis C-methylase UbiE